MSLGKELKVYTTKTSFATVMNMYVFLHWCKMLKLICITSNFLYAHKDLEVWWLCVWSRGCWMTSSRVAIFGICQSSLKLRYQSFTHNGSFGHK